MFRSLFRRSELSRDTQLPAYLRQAADLAGYKINIKPVHNTMKKIDVFG